MNSAELLEAFDGIVTGRPGPEPAAVFARLRSDLPVFFSPRLGAWVLSRYDDVWNVLSDAARFSPPKDGPGAAPYGRSFLQMDGREHNKKVGIVSRRIRSPRALREEVEGTVAHIAAQRASALPYDEHVDLREDYAMWIPLLTITELTEIDEGPRFRDWYRVIAAGGVSSIADPAARDRALVAREELIGFLEPLIAERRRDPGDDLISDLVTAEYDGALLPWEEIAATVVFLLVAGVETTERALTSALAYLIDEPRRWSALRERKDDVNALTSFAAEALRLFPPVNGVTRTNAEATTIGDVSIPAHQTVLVSIASANRDEERFPNADRFEDERFAANPSSQFTSAGDVLPFGAGQHHCAGSRLAQTELVHGLGRLLEHAARIEPIGEIPAPQGFILRSPPTLPVLLRSS